MAAPGKIMNIDNLLGVGKNRIARVGVELEGGWVTVPAGCRVQRDSSVQVTSNDPNLILSNIGEIASDPRAPVGIAAWMRKYYPAKVDASCGLHVHMSFEAVRYYQLLMDTPDYQATMLHYLGVWAKKEGLPAAHSLYPRLAGKNEYCNQKFWPEKQARDKQKDYDHHRDGNRYSAITYPWSRHGTIECRVLPMMRDVEESIRGVHTVLEITNACVYFLGRARDERVKTGVSMAHEGRYTEKIIQKL